MTFTLTLTSEPPVTAGLAKTSSMGDTSFKLSSICTYQQRLNKLKICKKIYKNKLIMYL